MHKDEKKEYVVTVKFIRPENVDIKKGKSVFLTEKQAEQYQSLGQIKPKKKETGGVPDMPAKPNKGAEG